MKKTNIFGLVLILSTLLIGCAQSSHDEDIPEVYTITAAETTNGTISLSKTTAAAGETITVTATPASGYSLASISAGSNITLTGDGNARTFTMPASNVTVTATFTQTNYSITAAETTNGTISLSKTTAAAGETITVTATPETGYNVFDIKVGDNHLVISTNNTAEFTMPSSNVTVSVTFVKSTTPVVFFKDSDFVSIVEDESIIVNYMGVDTYNYQSLSSLSIKYISISSDPNNSYIIIGCSGQAKKAM